MLYDYAFKSTCKLNYICIHKTHYYNYTRNENMKEIFQEYGGILITVVAILAVILVITAVVGTDTSGPIGSAFQTLVKNFIDQANKNTGLPTP